MLAKDAGWPSSANNDLYSEHTEQTKDYIKLKIII